MQTRFATTALTLLLSSLGISPEAESDAAALALQAPLPEGLAEYRRIVFLGAGWTVGLAAEAALKIREAAGAWTESYPAMEYRHGPIIGRLDRDPGVADRRRRPHRAGRGRRRRLDHRPNRRSTARLAGTGPARRGRTGPRPRARSRPPSQPDPIGGAPMKAFVTALLVLAVMAAGCGSSSSSSSSGGSGAHHDVARLRRHRGRSHEVDGGAVQRVASGYSGQGAVLRQHRLRAAEGADRDRERRSTRHLLPVRVVGGQHRPEPQGRSI